MTNTCEANTSAESMLPDDKKALPDHPLLSAIKKEFATATEAAVMTLAELQAEDDPVLEPAAREAHADAIALLNAVFEDVTQNLMASAMQTARLLSDVDPEQAHEVLTRSLFALSVVSRFYAEVGGSMHVFANAGHPVDQNAVVLPAGVNLLNSLTVKVSDGDTPTAGFLPIKTVH